MARVLGSYPIGRWFKSYCRYHYGPLVKRLRHRPFTAESWVQFPYGSPFHIPTNGYFKPFVGFLFSERSPQPLIDHLFLNLTISAYSAELSLCVFYAPNACPSFSFCSSSLRFCTSIFTHSVGLCANFNALLIASQLRARAS